MAYALEASPTLLPYLPELLQDLDELGSDAELIAEVVASLGLGPGSTVIDLGSGKGVAAIEIADECGCSVLGVDLFAPFVEESRERARREGVEALCTFVHGDVEDLAGRLAPVDAVVYAALGDTLGGFDETVGLIRRYVKPGGFIVIADSCLRTGVTARIAGFENHGTLAEMSLLLQAHGDELILARTVEDDADGDDGEIDLLRTRALAIAARHPDVADAVQDFIASQQEEYDFLRDSTQDVVWVLRTPGPPRTGRGD